MAFSKENIQRARLERGDLEFIAVPMKTPRVVITDRADGSLWLLTFNTTVASPDGLGHISIVQPVPDSPDKGNLHVYGPYDGPYVRWIDTPLAHSQGRDPRPDVYAKLLVRGGYLGFETSRFDVKNTRVMARVRVQRINREIIRPSTYHEGDQFEVLAWRDLEF